MKQLYIPKKAIYRYTPYFEIYYDEALQLFRSFWHIQSEWISDEEFKECMYNFWDLIKKHKPKIILADCRLFNFIIDHDLQIWYGKIAESFESKSVEKIAFLKSDNLIEQFSFEQAVAEDHRTHIEIAYFYAEEEAYQWLKLTKQDFV